MRTPSYHQPDICTPVPEELAKFQQFVGWRYKKRTGKTKPAKVPVNPRTGEQASVDNPESWGPTEEAMRCAKEGGLDGIGFVFTASDPFAGVDLDDCRNPDTGELEPWASKIVEKFGSYTEVSPSGTGVKIIMGGQLPGPGTHRGRVEMYDQGRFFTLTGDVLRGYETVKSCPRLLAALYKKVKRPAPAAGKDRAPNRRGAVPVPVEDEELLEKARNAGNSKGFRRLFDEGDVSTYNSRSEADLALCGMLAFWTGRDQERMERLFTASALGQREKWLKRPDYRKGTIDLAAARCERIYNPEPCAEGEVHKILEELRHFAVTHPWTGRSGPRERWLYTALINTGGGYGKACPEGVIVAASSRELALKCGTRRQTVEGLLKKLEERGLVRLIEKARGSKAAKYLLLAPPKVGHKESHTPPKVGHREHVLTPPPVLIIHGPVSALLGKLRNAAPQTEKNFDKNGRRISHNTSEEVNPLGALCALMVEKILAWPGLTELELAAVMERESHHLRRYLNVLLDCGLVNEEDGALFPALDLVDRLLDELEASGCNGRERNLRDKYAKERERHRVWLLARRRFSHGQIAGRLGISVDRVRAILKKPDPVPDEALDEYESRRREELAEQGASGFIGELESVEYPTTKTAPDVVGSVEEVRDMARAFFVHPPYRGDLECGG